MFNSGAPIANDIRKGCRRKRLDLLNEKSSLDINGGRVILGGNFVDITCEPISNIFCLLAAIPEIQM